VTQQALNSSNGAWPIELILLFHTSLSNIEKLKYVCFHFLQNGFIGFIIHQSSS